MAANVSNSSQLVVWVLQTGEPLHTDDDGLRPMRAMNLSNALTQAGHKVVLWSSSFYHQKKKHRSAEYKLVKIHETLEVRLVPSPGYRRNIGFGRLFDHALLAVKLKRLLEAETSRPDVIFVGYPPIEFAYVAINFSAKNGIPSVLDVKDQWPHIFVEAFPRLAQPLVKIAFFVYFWLARKTIFRATSLVSMTSAFLSWAQDFGGRSRIAKDAVFPLTSYSEELSTDEVLHAKEWWRDLGLQLDDSKIIRLIFAGSLSKSFDFKPIAAIAKMANDNNMPWQFIICGAGDQEAEVRNLFTGLSNAIFPGWVDRKKIAALADSSQIGLAPYKNVQNFNDNLPNKIMDYMSLGLAVISPLRGEVKKLIDDFQVGVTYDEQDERGLYQQILSLVADDESLSRMRSASRAAYDQNFRGEKVYERLVQHIENLAAQEGR